jgi:Na+-driven multidrug efflux pump
MMIAQEETGKVNIESALKLGKLDTAQKYVLPFTCILALVEGILLGMTSTGRRLIIYMLCLLVIFALFPLIFAQFDNIGHHIINYIDISGAVFERIILATILSRLINKIRRQTGSSQSNVI